MIKNLINIFFPQVCFGCNNFLSDNEKYVCTSCRHELPVTNYHFDNRKEVKKVLYGRVKLVHATALLRFEKKGIVQQLLHKLKYKGYEDIGLFLGEWLATELKETGEYDDIDIVISVPLHKRKLKKRGYNQVEKFAKAIANSLEVPYNNQVLQKLSSTTTQVFKKRISRWNDKDEVFKLVDSGLIENKHILLCDDIITTGATIEACANELLKATNVKISVVTMAIA